jgi:predicted RNase H-like HicB family nuclease
MQEVFSNWPEIIAEGAEGNMASPETAHQYAAIAMIHSSWATNNWQAVEFPEEIRKFVKLRNHCKIDGKDFFVPQLYELPEIGAVIGVGDTLDECIEHLRSNAEQVKGYYLEIKLDSIDKALEEIHSAKEIGIEI